MNGYWSDGGALKPSIPIAEEFDAVALHTAPRPCSAGARRSSPARRTRRRVSSCANRISSLPEQHLRVSVVSAQRARQGTRRSEDCGYFRASAFTNFINSISVAVRFSAFRSRSLAFSPCAFALLRAFAFW